MAVEAEAVVAGEADAAGLGGGGAVEAPAQAGAGREVDFREGTGAGAPEGGSSGVADEGWVAVPEVLRGLGWTGSREGASDREVLEELVGAARRAGEADYYAQLGRQLAPHYQGIVDYLGGQGEPQPQQPAA